ncbi:endomucin isoform 1-T1 [Mantella aurantiaca]
MLVRTMKPSGAAAMFLAVINLLTVSSSSAKLTDYTSSQTPDLQDSRTASTITSLISTAAGKYQSSPTIGSSLSATTGDASSPSTLKSTTISSVFHSPTEQIPGIDTSDDKDVNSSTVASDKMTSAPPKEENPNVGAEATTASIQEFPSKEASTGPSIEAQTKAVTNDKDSKTQDNSNSSSGADKISATSDKDSTKQDSNNSSGGADKMSATSNRGIKIGAGCVAAVIGVIVLVVIYKICQRKSPATENTEVKTSAETKENVKLLSVKTETPNSDMKRSSSNQMECIEC